MKAQHDELVVGAGCAGMRAAIEAFDAGTDLALISKIHPTHSHSDAAEGRIDAALGNGSCGGESVDYLKLARHNVSMKTVLAKLET